MGFNNLIKWKIHINLKMIPWPPLVTKICPVINCVARTNYKKIKTKKLPF